MSPRRSVARHLFTVGPHAGAHRVALRAAISIAVPLLTLYAIGRLDWAVYAAFGAFTALYGRSSVHGHRLRMQATAATVFVVAVVTGTAIGISPQRAWIVVPAAAVFAALVSLVSDRQRWHPPGALFPIFALAACASIPSQPADLLPAALIVTASALFALVVGAVGALRRGRSLRSGPLPAGAVQPRHAVRSGAGVLIAGAIATVSGIGHPYWAMVSAVVPLSPTDFPTQIAKGAQRVIGTFAGLAVAAAILLSHPPALVLVLVVIGLQFGAEMLIGRNYALALLVVTPLALIMVDLAAPGHIPSLLLERGVETVIGVAVGIAVAWLTRAPLWRRRSAGDD